MRLDLKPGHNCWKRTHADRATPLIDAANYFSVLVDALRLAESRIFIVGWDVHGLVRLTRPATGHAETFTGSEGVSLRDLLLELATDKPSLEIKILLWDFTVLYAADRLPFPKAVLDWSLPENVALALDNRVPFGASHHQKIVVVDDKLAFVGGIDLTEERWDTCLHTANDERRVTARGQPYGPFHDVQLALDGEAAATLGAVCRQRWESCTTRSLEPVAAESAPWPEALDVTWRDIEVGIARTAPAFNEQEGIAEVLQLYLDSIHAAEEYIYIENQYLTADAICDALADRLKEPNGPEIVLVTQWSTQSWLEKKTMGVRRERFLARLAKADRHGRARIFAPRAPGIDMSDYNLHSKVAIVDDRIVRIGSANLNNRSMGFDTECDAVLVCRSSADRQAAREFRDSLIAEHVGTEPENVTAAIDKLGSLIGAIDSLNGNERMLRALPIHKSTASASEVLAEVADTRRPLSTAEWLDRLKPSWETSVDEQSSRWALKAGLLGVFILLLAATWRYTDVGALAEPAIVQRWLGSLPSSTTGVLIGILVFVVGGLFVVPVTALIIATAFAFGLWPGVITSVLGTYASAAVTFAIGRTIGAKAFRRWNSARAQMVKQRLARNGIIAVAVLRVVPIAPFTVVNAIAGASTIRFRDFALGTILGMTPGTALLVAMGGQLNAALRDPTAQQLYLFIAISILWLGVGLLLQRIINRIERTHRSKQKQSANG